MARPLIAHVDLNALSHNLNLIHHYAKGTKILAMIKANAYGHGLVDCARALKAADALGVACIEEALEIRAAKINKRIVLMEGFFDRQELDDIVQFDLETMVHNHFQLNTLMALTKQKKIRVWLKINTGMNRLGFHPSEFEQIYNKIKACAHLQIICLVSHLSSADDLSSSKTTAQIDLFKQLTKTCMEEKCLANSAGILAWPSSHFDWVRPGLMLYGVSPFKQQIGRDFDLKPVMELNSKIIAVQALQAGDKVGYGESYCCEQAMCIGIVAVGYGDGYFRMQLPDSAYVSVRGSMAKILGRISMDMIAIDLSQFGPIEIGEQVELWGSHLPVERLALMLNTRAYELLAGLSSRVPLHVKSSLLCSAEGHL